MGEPTQARGAFVAGTGTEVGKTIVAAVLAHTLAAEGRRVHVFKPAVTGLAELRTDGPISGEMGPFSARRQLADHELLRLASGSRQSDAEIAPYRYDPPASPHLAAQLAGGEVKPERLREAARAAAAGADFLVCEGVGGLLVPLSLDYSVRDLAADLGYPLVVVSPPGLGTINHTLLTIDSARAAGLEVAAVVLNPWPAEPSAIERDNRRTVAALRNVPVLTLPPLDPTNPATWPPVNLPPTGRFRET